MKSSRKPSIQEERLLELLIRKASVVIQVDWMTNLIVEPMKDDGMGSLYLFPNGVKRNRKFGKCVSEYQFVDKDGIEVIVSLNIDDKGELFELDIWKTDFSQLTSFPEI